MTWEGAENLRELKTFFLNIILSSSVEILFYLTEVLEGIYFRRGL